jgi:hypothetical protein
VIRFGYGVLPLVYDAIIAPFFRFGATDLSTPISPRSGNVLEPRPGNALHGSQGNVLVGLARNLMAVTRHERTPS